MTKISKSSIPIGSGSYSWNIPINQKLGTDYKIRITSTTSSTYTDTSNENFAIVGPTPFSVSGRVTTGDGNGIEGVQMTFTLVSGIKIKMPPTVKTDANGFWNQKGFMSGTTYRITPNNPIPTNKDYLFTPYYLDFSNEKTDLNFIGIPTILGIDISYAATNMPDKVWQDLWKEGRKFAIVGAWGGRGPNPYAYQQLQSARKNNFTTAAYVLLNFDNKSQNGEWQVNQALSAIKDEKQYISFIAIDVEPTCINKKCWAINVNPEVRISEAVNAVNNATLKPIIYSSNSGWNSLGLKNVNGFNNLPLWDAYGDNQPAIQKNWILFGGWNGRTGKQYKLDINKYGKPMDLDIFDPKIFGLN